MVREMKHTEIGEIPVEWEIQTFEETFRMLSNNTLPRAEMNNCGGTVRNVHYGDILTRFGEVLDCEKDEVPYLNDGSLLTASAQVLQDGDLILADTAEDDTVGKATEVYGLGKGRMVAGLHTIPCRVKKGDFVPKWLGYYMNSPIYHNQVLPYVTGIKVSSISKTAISETLIAVPPLEEQRVIVSALSEVDRLLVELKKVVSKLRDFKRGCLYLMFPQDGTDVPQMREPGYGEPWERRKMGDVCDYVDYRGKTPTKTETGIFLVTAKNVKNGYIDYDSSKEYIAEEDYEEVMHRGKPKIGDVLITTEAPCGNVAQVNSVNIALAQRIIKYRGYEKVVDNTYMKHYLLSPVFQKILAVKSSGGTVQGIKGSILHQQVIQYPTYDEQVSIGQYLDTLDLLITLHQQKFDKYSQIKKAMMNELITGKIKLV